ncbi:predicted protein [Streptomyces sp. SPB78]|uniref:hypothetical protein n=1 Tax=Streptomyces sp. (strain SPB78) TaxID=591157 RepID=UPI0001B56EAD|nr:hypothetical protein [Streptomyces sp. SPB78]EFL01621.1 predicted protein [Streptomyces sp. SPB78]
MTSSTTRAAEKTPAYWAHIRRLVDSAPPLTDDQRARIRAAFHHTSSEVKAA